LTVADFLMPSLGADMESATLTEWLVKPGDAVKRGGVVASVETAKGIIDIEIFDDGVVETLLVAPGAEVPVGTPLARYRATGAGAAAEAKPAVAPPPAAWPAPSSVATPLPPAPPPPLPRPAGGERQVASPAARRRATELGLDLATITPCAGNAITLQDVERAAAARPATPPAAAAPTDMRGLIAQSMSRSKREIPHYYLANTIDMRKALGWLEPYNAARPVTERLLYGVLLLKAVARALERFPELNGFWHNGRFEPATAINVGTAIRLRQGGLVAPALLAANAQSLQDLMRAFQDMVQRARGGGLRSTELASATVTVSSLGDGSVDTVFPIIHPPQVAIVGFGTVAVRPWCDAGAVVAAPVITATLSADHRVSDGHRGSAFLVAVGDWLQRPEAL
jgi:pyruvate dehydrogenase E2 component (dihydrolipoamide acetyltransferase)